MKMIILILCSLILIGCNQSGCREEARVLSENNSFYRCDKDQKLIFEQIKNAQGVNNVFVRCICEQEQSIACEISKGNL